MTHPVGHNINISSSYTDMQWPSYNVNNLRIDHTLQSNFSTFPICFKVGSSTMPVPFPVVCGQFRPEI